MNRTTHTRRDGSQQTVDRAPDGRFDYPRPNLSGAGATRSPQAAHEAFRLTYGPGTVNVYTWQSHLAAQRQTRNDKHNATVKAQAARWGF